MFFFFQAEDGIRDLTVTGVQTCALPISCWQSSWRDYPRVTDGSTSRNGTVPRAPLPRRPEWLLQSRDLKPLNRYFPELESTILEQLPSRAVVDGEVVIAGEAGLDFEALH